MMEVTLCQTQYAGKLHSTAIALRADKDKICFIFGVTCT